ncbi:MAG: DUF86 domain-containing protein [Phycisphaerae bacterium]|nr:DUF86 domain-containing protein [Phycisphaerae bacterium]
MYDKELILDNLRQIHQAAKTIISRFEPVTKVEDFTDSAEGSEKLDSIAMLIIAIGEGLKNIDKTTNHKLLSQYPEIDWKGAKGMRDIISHHYFDIDAEEIYWVCQNKIRPLTETVAKIIAELRE